MQSTTLPPIAHRKPQESFRADDDEWFPVVAFHLTAQKVEILCCRRGVYNMHVDVGVFALIFRVERIIICQLRWSHDVRHKKLPGCTAAYLQPSLRAARGVLRAGAIKADESQ